MVRLRWIKTLAAAFAICLTAMLPHVAQAHLTPNSEIRIDLGEDSARLDIIVPLGDYAAATGNPTDNSTPSIDAARRYITENLALSDQGGNAWDIALHEIEFVQIAGPPDLHAVATARPASASGLRAFSLDWTGVVRDVPGHFALIVLGDDMNGRVGTGREVLGMIRAGNTRLEIDRGRASGWVAFANAVRLGAAHIAEGFDHLLFLIALLLPAPLIAARGKWTERRNLKGTFGLLARIVTAFTIGHSVTLVGASLFNWRLPVAPVEIAIGVSVLVSAIHAARPIFPAREPLVAGMFGLIHGLAFATLIADYGLGLGSRVVSILGFNIGIELLQIAIVAVVAPCLVLMARSTFYPPVRWGIAVFAMVASAAWIVERSTGMPNVVGTLLERFFELGPWLIAIPVVLAMAALMQGRQRTT